jgi:hypothetical protein
MQHVLRALGLVAGGANGSGVPGLQDLLRYHYAGQLEFAESEDSDEEDSDYVDEEEEDEEVGTVLAAVNLIEPETERILNFIRRNGMTRISKRQWKSRRT